MSFLSMDDSIPGNSTIKILLGRIQNNKKKLKGRCIKKFFTFGNDEHEKEKLEIMIMLFNDYMLLAALYRKNRQRIAMYNMVENAASLKIPCTNYDTYLYKLSKFMAEFYLEEGDTESASKYYRDIINMIEANIAISDEKSLKTNLSFAYIPNLVRDCETFIEIYKDTAEYSTIINSNIIDVYKIIIQIGSPVQALNAMRSIIPIAFYNKNYDVAIEYIEKFMNEYHSSQTLVLASLYISSLSVQKCLAKFIQNLPIKKSQDLIPFIPIVEAEKKYLLQENYTFLTKVAVAIINRDKNAFLQTIDVDIKSKNIVWLLLDTIAELGF
jgi:hypothetical protein